MARGSVSLVDPVLGVQVINDTDLDIDAGTVWEHVQRDSPEVATMVRWVTSVTGGDNWGPAGQNRSGTLFQRDRYVTPDSIHEQYRVARDAAENDDVVGGIVDSTEALAFNRMSFLTEDEDEEDVWNQIARDLDLDARLREMWRELMIFSQFYCCIWWGDKTYKVRGKTTQGNQRRKTFENLRVPLGLTLLDPQKVIPVGGLLFNQDQLAYMADPAEIDMLDAAAANDPRADPLARQIILEPFEPNDVERRQLSLAGITINYLYRLNPANVFRHTLTRPQYQRFASVRMKSIFPILDLKEQLRQMDRATLVGGTNFIVLVKKGTDAMPAKPVEIDNLKNQVRTVARVPVLVGDHRLSVEIVTPNNDNTLDPKRYDALNASLKATLYQMFSAGGAGSTTSRDDSIKLGKLVGRGMESRRRQLRRVLEVKVLRPTYAANDSFTNEASMRFHPARIDLTFDPAMATMLVDMRDRGDISRETYVGEVDVDQADEALLRTREKERFDDIFTPTAVPYSAPPPEMGPGGQPVNADPRTAGRNKGGNRNGGGAAPGSGQGQAPRSGKPKDKPSKRAAAVEADEDYDGDEDEDA